MSRPQFNSKLESLRGLAALAVCFTHSIAIYRLDQSNAIWDVPIFKQSWGTACITLVNAFFNPAAAVILFFILSGYVLTQSIRQRDTREGVIAFYLKRCFRILPMMWASLLLIWILSTINHTPPANQVSLWYLVAFEQPVNFHNVVKNLLLVNFPISPVTWTMRIELLGSLLMPAMIWVVTRGTLFQRILLFGVLCLLTAISHGDFQYLICFYIGSLLASKYTASLWSHSPWFPVISGVMTCAILRLSFAHYTHPRANLLLTTAGAAFVLIGILTGSGRFGILETTPLRFLGRVSYSLYLLHPPVLGLCSVASFALGLYPNWPAAFCNTALFIVSVMLTLAVSALSYRWIEQPFISMGRAITRRSFSVESNTKKAG